MATQHTLGDFTFFYSAHVGAGTTVTFSGTKAGTAATDATGSAAITDTPGFAPTTTTVVLHESATDGTCAATTSLIEPHQPGG